MDRSSIRLATLPPLRSVIRLTAVHEPHQVNMDFCAYLCKTHLTPFHPIYPPHLCTLSHSFTTANPNNAVRVEQAIYASGVHMHTIHTFYYCHSESLL